MKLSIYLAGWSEEMEYRKISKENYGNKIDFLDPMTIAHLEVIEKIGIDHYDTYIVRRDKKMIDLCDILVAYIRIGATYGTLFEIAYADSKSIPVYVIDPTEGMEVSNNAWLRFHCTKRFPSIKDCFEYILPHENKQ